MSIRLPIVGALAVHLTGCLPAVGGADADPEPILIKTACPITPPPRCEVLRGAGRLSELTYGRDRCVLELDARWEEWQDCRND